MPHCQNCGGHVTTDYQRVMTPPDVEQVRCCPDCDPIRDGAEIRGARSKPHGKGGPPAAPQEVNHD